MMKPFLIDKISFKNNFLSYADHESIFGDGVGGEGTLGEVINQLP